MKEIYFSEWHFERQFEQMVVLKYLEASGFKIISLH